MPKKLDKQVASLIEVFEDYKNVLKQKNNQLEDGDKVWFIEFDRSSDAIKPIKQRDQKLSDRESIRDHESTYGKYYYSKRIVKEHLENNRDAWTSDNIESELSSRKRIIVNGKIKGLLDQEVKDKKNKNIQRIQLLDKMLSTLNNQNIPLEARFSSTINDFKQNISFFELNTEETHKKERQSFYKMRREVVIFISVGILTLGATLGFYPIYLLFLLQPSQKSSEKFTNKTKKIIATNVIDALEMQCHDYIKRLNQELAYYRPNETEKAYPKRAKLTMNIIEEITSLKNTLTTSEPDEIKINKFTQEYTRLKKQGYLSSEKTSTTKRFITAIGYILATVLTLGLYPAIKARHSTETKGTMRFWHAKEDVFKRDISNILKKTSRK